MRTFWTPSRINLAIDLSIFIAFLIAMAPRTSGIAIHEWLSIAFGAAIIAHLLLHWQWIVQVTRRLFGHVAVSARINHLLNVLLFIDLTVVILSGLLISEAALPALGIQVERGGAWRGLHDLSANAFMLLIGLHIALHWHWIVRTVGRLGHKRHRSPAALQAAADVEEGVE